MATIDINAILENSPSQAKLILAGMVILGLIVWVWGRKLAKPICMVTGPFIGAVIGLVVAHSIGWHGRSLIASFIGAFTGFGAALMLFRVWMAVSLAIVLTVAFSVGFVAWSMSQPSYAPSFASAPTTQEWDELDTFKAPLLPVAASQPTPMTRRDRLVASIRQQFTEVKKWWAELPDGAKVAALVPAAVGLAFGMFLGLWKPLAAASVESALLGGLCWFLAARELLNIYWPWAGERLPRQPHMVLLLVGLITLLGVLLQWTISERQADK